MSLSAWILMIVVLSLTWGLFGILLAVASRKERNRAQRAAGDRDGSGNKKGKEDGNEEGTVP
jgi:hypothetical protein